MVWTSRWLGEALRVAQVPRHEGLGVGQHLADVVAVVVHPFVEQIGDGEEADGGVVPAARQVGRGEAGDERTALCAQRRELVAERRAVARAVVSLARDGFLVPALESGAGAREDRA